jgi:hypothetical protein
MKVGDEVQYREAFFHGVGRASSTLIYIARISGETPKFWKVGKLKFRKSDGSLIPQYLNYDRFIQPIPETTTTEDVHA